MGGTVLLLNFLPALDSSYAHKGSIYPSTASLLLGTVLKKAGYKVKIIDGAYHPDYVDIVKHSLDDDVIYVGMTVMTTQIPFALDASKAVKEISTTIPVVWGGPHPTLFPKETLQNNNVDIVVINEGAATSVELADCLENKRDIGSVTGIGYKTGSGSVCFTAPRELDDIQTLPFFDFSLIDIDKYLHPPSGSVYQREFPHYDKKIRVLPILTALGCPYRCQFCINVILKRKYRLKPAQSIVDEIKKCMDAYDVNTFFFLDEDFFINKNRALEFISLAEKEHLHFNWRMWCRVDHFKENYINREVLDRMARIGHGSLVMGGESANQRILDRLCKDITIQQITDSLRVLTGTTITPRYSFMVGLENETMDEIHHTYRFCLDLMEINPDVDIAGPFIFRLYPGSPIYNRLVQAYDIRIPETLEGWSELLRQEVSFTKIPWTPAEFQKNCDLLVFYSNFAYIRKTDRIHTFKGFLIHLLSKTARIRIRYFVFRFPVEYWLFNLYRKSAKK